MAVDGVHVIVVLAPAVVPLPLCVPSVIVIVDPLSKLAKASDICDAIVAVAAGQTVIPPEVQAHVASEIRHRAAADRPALTDRELQILRQISTGASAPTIAGGLGLSPATVKTHLRHVYEKLGVSDRAAAVAEAMRRGLI